MSAAPVTQVRDHSKPFEGWLMKRGGMMKTWHNRWFILKDRILFQFAKEDDIRPQTSYFLADSKYRVLELPFNHEEPDKYGFDLTPDSGTGETVSLCASSAAIRQNWIKAIRYALFAEKGGAIFGQSLDETMRYSHAHGRPIPAIIEKCVDFLTAHGLQVEGIFRLPGRTTLVRDLKERFDCGEDVNFENLEPDVHSVASLLKMYLRELPESIIPCKLYQSYMNFALRYLDAKEEATKRKCVMDLASNMSHLPRDNYTILKYLCKFLKHVVSHAKVNKMTVENLALVFGPNIIRHMDDNPELFMLTADLTQQLAYMLINDHDTVFTFDYRKDGNVPEADLLRLSTLDGNPVLNPQIVTTSAHNAMEELASLDLKFADEVFDQLSQSSEQSPLSPESPLSFSDNYFCKDKNSLVTMRDSESASNSPTARPVPPKRRSKIVRGRRISERRPGSHGDAELVRTPEDPSRTLTDSIKQALGQQEDEELTNGTGNTVSTERQTSIEQDNKVQQEDRLHQIQDDKVHPSAQQMRVQSEGLKLELVNMRTRYEANIKALQTENRDLRGSYEKRITAMEAMIHSQNECLRKEKKDRAEAVERVVRLQAQLHQYQMQYGELRT